MLKYRNIFYDFVPVNNYIQSRYFLFRFNRITCGLNDSIKQKLITFISIVLMFLKSRFLLFRLFGYDGTLKHWPHIGF